VIIKLLLPVRIICDYEEGDLSKAYLGEVPMFFRYYVISRITEHLGIFLIENKL